SMGGLVSLWTAMHYPERVGRLALIGTPVYPEDKPPILWPMRWPVIGSIYERMIGPWAVEPIARTVFVDKSLVDAPMLEEYGRAFRTRGGARAIATFFRRVPDDAERYTSRYRTLPHPTLVIRGAADGVVHQASCERFVSEHPRAKLVALENLGHAPHEERPGVVN